MHRVRDEVSQHGRPHAAGPANRSFVAPAHVLAASILKTREVQGCQPLEGEPLVPDDSFLARHYAQRRQQEASTGRDEHTRLVFILEGYAELQQLALDEELLQQLTEEGSLSEAALEHLTELLTHDLRKVHGSQGEGPPRPQLTWQPTLPELLLQQEGLAPVRGQCRSMGNVEYVRLISAEHCLKTISYTDVVSMQRAPPPAHTTSDAADAAHVAVEDAQPPHMDAVGVGGLDTAALPPDPALRPQQQPAMVMVGQRRSITVPTVVLTLQRETEGDGEAVQPPLFLKLEYPLTLLNHAEYLVDRELFRSSRTWTPGDTFWSWWKDADHAFGGEYYQGTVMRVVDKAGAWRGSPWNQLYVKWTASGAETQEEDLWLHAWEAITEADCPIERRYKYKAWERRARRAAAGIDHDEDYDGGELGDGSDKDQLLPRRQRRRLQAPASAGAGRNNSADCFGRQLLLENPSACLVCGSSTGGVRRFCTAAACSRHFHPECLELLGAAGLPVWQYRGSGADRGRGAGGGREGGACSSRAASASVAAAGSRCPLPVHQVLSRHSSPAPARSASADDGLPDAATTSSSSSTRLAGKRSRADQEPAARAVMPCLGAPELACPAHMCHGCGRSGQVSYLLWCCGCWVATYHYSTCVPEAAQRVQLLVEVDGQVQEQAYVLCPVCVAGGVQPPEVCVAASAANLLGAVPPPAGIGSAAGLPTQQTAAAAPGSAAGVLHSGESDVGVEAARPPLPPAAAEPAEVGAVVPGSAAAALEGAASVADDLLVVDLAAARPPLAPPAAAPAEADAVVPGSGAAAALEGAESVAEDPLVVQVVQVETTLPPPAAAADRAACAAGKGLIMIDLTQDDEEEEEEAAPTVQPAPAARVQPAAPTAASGEAATRSTVPAQPLENHASSSQASAPPAAAKKPVRRMWEMVRYPRPAAGLSSPFLPPRHQVLSGRAPIPTTAQPLPQDQVGEAALQQPPTTVPAATAAATHGAAGSGGGARGSAAGPEPPAAIAQAGQQATGSGTRAAPSGNQAAAACMAAPAPPLAAGARPSTLPLATTAATAVAGPPSQSTTQPASLTVGSPAADLGALPHALPRHQVAPVPVVAAVGAAPGSAAALQCQSGNHQQQQHCLRIAQQQQQQQQVAATPPQQQQSVSGATAGQPVAATRPTSQQLQDPQAPQEPQRPHHDPQQPAAGGRVRRAASRGVAALVAAERQLLEAPEDGSPPAAAAGRHRHAPRQGRAGLIAASEDPMEPAAAAAAAADVAALASGSAAAAGGVGGQAPQVSISGMGPLHHQNSSLGGLGAHVTQQPYPEQQQMQMVLLAPTPARWRQYMPRVPATAAAAAAGSLGGRGSRATGSSSGLRPVWLELRLLQRQHAGAPAWQLACNRVGASSSTGSSSSSSRLQALIDLHPDYSVFIFGDKDHDDRSYGQGGKVQDWVSPMIDVAPQPLADAAHPAAAAAAAPTALVSALAEEPASEVPGSSTAAAAATRVRTAANRTAAPAARRQADRAPRGSRPTLAQCARLLVDHWGPHIRARDQLLAAEQAGLDAAPAVAPAAPLAVHPAAAAATAWSGPQELLQAAPAGAAAPQVVPAHTANSTASSSLPDPHQLPAALAQQAAALKLWQQQCSRSDRVAAAAVAAFLEQPRRLPAVHLHVVSHHLVQVPQRWAGLVARGRVVELRAADSWTVEVDDATRVQFSLNQLW